MIRQAVILAGGLGSRLQTLTEKTPKPMVAFHGKPFVEYLVEMLRGQGIKEIVFLLGYLPEAVMNYFGDGRNLGLSVRYSVQPVETDTGSRLKAAADLLEDSFLLLYCDNYLPLRLQEMWDFWKRSEREAMITVYANTDGWTRSNLKVDAEGFVSIYDKSRTRPDLQGVDIGFGFFQKHHIAGLPEGNVSFEKELYPFLVQKGQLAGYVTHHRYYSVGSLERLKETEKFLAFPKAIFLDRDGVLNRKAEAGQYVSSPEDFVWLPGSLEALRLLRESGYAVFVITNQAGIARGILSQETLDAIHAEMCADAEAAGGSITKVYVCPHHWDENCECRKPKPGLLFVAQREQALDLTRCSFVGDQDSDRQAAQAAGCDFLFKSPGISLLELTQRMLNQEKS